jgi:multicomponent Na+:H+ antiporter subunit B
MAERVLLVLLIVFALQAIRQRQLRTAAIYLGVFSLVSSVLYLMCAAPDVAIAEAVIGSTLATVLYLVALQKQERLADVAGATRSGQAATSRAEHIRHLAAGTFMLLVGGLFLCLYHESGPPGLTEVADLYRQRFLADTGARNAVTGIYLNYRIYDTLFETLTLQISVMGVIYFSRHQLAASSGTLAEEPGYGRISLPINRDQVISAPIVGLLLPFILVFGTAIVINGHLTPGGGFQGGAILAGVLILRYMILPVHDFRIDILQKLEKILFILIVLVPLLLVMAGPVGGTVWQVPYLIALNTLIACKVLCGISIIFIRFVFYESR